MTGIMCAIAGSGGTVGGTVGVTDLNPSDAKVNITAQCGLILNSSGSYTSSNEAGGDYCTPTSLASALEARLVFNSGDNEVSGAALNAWLPLTTTRTWTLAAAPGFTKSANCTLTIREVVSLIVRDTSTIVFDAESFDNS